jgi:hypothetical protein
MATTPQTLGGMKARIARELARTNLTDQIADAINDAIAAYADDRFRFSDINPAAPPTFNTVIGQTVYGAAANANIASAFKIDYVLINVGTATVQYLDRREPEDIKLYLQQNTMQGVPSDYAYEGNSLILAPAPSAVYLITLGLFLNVPAPAADDTVGNPWMTDAELLIRSRAKFEIATHVTRNKVMAQAMSPSSPDENGGVVGAAYREWTSS